jgi:hypothetical protein
LPELPRETAGHRQFDLRHATEMQDLATNVAMCQRHDRVDLVAQRFKFASAYRGWSRTCWPASKEVQ